MAAHHGAIEVDSVLGQGSVFRLYLPAQVSRDSELSRVSSGELSVSLGGPEVLLADDEELLRSTAAMMFQDLGYEVDVVENGGEAVARFQADPQRYGLVVLDQVMPVLTGLDAAHAIHDLRPSVPIILCSGFPQAAEVTAGLQTVLRGFLQKPYSRKALVECLQSCIASAGEDRPGTTHYHLSKAHSISE